MQRSQITLGSQQDLCAAIVAALDELESLSDFLCLFNSFYHCNIKLTVFCFLCRKSLSSWMASGCHQLTISGIAPESWDAFESDDESSGHLEDEHHADCSG